MPAPMAQVVAKLQTNATSCTATFSQLAAVQALRGDQSPVDAMVAEFRRRRDAIVDGLRAIPGFSCSPPKGAFYVFPNITRTGYGSKALADKLLDQGGVACLRGTAFGSSAGGPPLLLWTEWRTSRGVEKDSHVVGADAGRSGHEVTVT